MRQLLVIALGWSLLGTTALAADGPAPVRPAQRKAAIEKKLDQPLQWDLADREQVTLAEFIAFVQDKHGLKIRWDAGSLAFMQGEQSPLMGLMPVASSAPSYYPSPDEAPRKLGAYSSVVPYVSPVESAVPQTLPPEPQTTYEDSVEPPTDRIPEDRVPDDRVPEGFIPADEPAAPRATAGLPSSAPPGPPPAKAEPFANPPVIADKEETSDDASNAAQELIATYAAAPIAISAVSLEQATVREGLRQLLDAIPCHAGAAVGIGVPITTRAMNLDVLVDENSVSITTQLRANAAKETRIYRLGALSEMPPDTLVRVITHSVRPWSWRSQVHEIADQLATRWPHTPVPLPALTLDFTEGVKLASSEDAVEPQPATTVPGVSEESVAATGQLLAGGAVAAVDTVVAALEIVHHGDPPTGVIEALPGLLIITQSQSAHREIEQLLDALREAE